MAKYSVSNAQGTPAVLTTTYKTQISLTAATGATTLRRAWIYDLTFSADAAPADTVIVYKADRCSSAGTAGATAVPAPLDAADAAALIVAGVCHSAEPTPVSATQLIEVAVNQRASYRWVAAPGGELVVPAVNVTGIAMRAKSPTYVSTVLNDVHFYE